MSPPFVGVRFSVVQKRVYADCGVIVYGVQSVDDDRDHANGTACKMRGRTGSLGLASNGTENNRVLLLSPGHEYVDFVWSLDVTRRLIVIVLVMWMVKLSNSCWRLCSSASSVLEACCRHRKLFFWLDIRYSCP